MDWVGYGFELAERILRDSMYGGDGHKCAENLRVVMLHSALEKGDELKDIIFKNLAKDPIESPLKVVIATVALGIGVDLRYVAQVIHACPPQNLEAYIQHIGRGGQNSEMQCEAILYFNSSDLGCLNISKEIKEYCRNDTLCRRVFF
ncbi:ATP-dependent DNA helicase Q1-like [Saccostrea echinata]|uniref:ATP-dependent DNA helicase Q1-like n=1 Tax=Saccostrea echinata TaxID=191078 RepID=UPI002A83BD61|nr:ATP-dependent DNA helicase Q1-like [Saccostrea echinata]XP_061195348.1 ATP-dependent DNA helicase Q1-like [Saccostrea echinata]